MEEEGLFKDSDSESNNDNEGLEHEKDKGDHKEAQESDEDRDEDDKHSKKRGYPILACDHSAITGESLAVDRYMGEMIYYTTICKRGKAYTVVQAPAKTSFVGRTATMVAGAKRTGHFENVMNNIGTNLLVLVMAWILAAWIGGFFRHLPIVSPSEKSLLHYTLALLIIGVPVGLPVVTTTTMAVGAAYLARKRAIVQKLTAIESLAVRNASILCESIKNVLIPYDFY